MSHSLVMVVGEDYEEALVPFDENMVMEKYVKYTKPQLIEKARKEIEEYRKGRYQEYLDDPEKYRAECKKNDSHFKYVSEEFPKKLTWTDEEIYQDEIKFYEEEDIGKDGEVYSEYNPKSRWDWYSLGGRWQGAFKLKEGARGERGEKSYMREDEAPEGYADQALKKDIDWEGMRKEAIANAEEGYEEAKKWREITKEEYVKERSSIAPFAILYRGEWIEKGKMGWWGMVRDEKQQEDWNATFEKILSEIDDNEMLSMVDVHI